MNSCARASATISPPSTMAQNSSPPMRPATDPGGPPGRPRERRRDRLESGVALGVGLVAVVGRLEAVDVGHDQGDRAAVLAVHGQRLVEPLLDEASVAQAGQRVGVRQPPDPLVVLDLAQARRDQAGERHAEVDVVGCGLRAPPLRLG